MDDPTKYLMDDPTKYLMDDPTKYLMDDPTKYLMDDPTKYLMDDPTKYLMDDPTKYLMDDPTKYLMDDPTKYLMDDPTKYLMDDPTKYLMDDPTKYLMDDPTKYLMDDPTKYLDLDASLRMTSRRGGLKPRIVSSKLISKPFAALFSPSSSDNSSFEPVFRHKKPAETTFDKLFEDAPSPLGLVPMAPQESSGEDLFSSARSQWLSSPDEPSVGLFTSLSEGQDSEKPQTAQKPRRPPPKKSHRVTTLSPRLSRDRQFSDDTLNHQVSFMNESEYLSEVFKLETHLRPPRISLLDQSSKPPMVTSTPNLEPKPQGLRHSLLKATNLSLESIHAHVPDLPCHIETSPAAPTPTPDVEQLLEDLSSLNISPDLGSKPERKMVRIGPAEGVSFILDSPPLLKSGDQSDSEHFQAQGGKKWRRTLFHKTRQSTQGPKSDEIWSCRRKTVASALREGVAPIIPQRPERRTIQVKVNALESVNDDVSRLLERSRVDRAGSFVFEASTAEDGLSAETSILVDPELSTIDKVLMRCSQSRIVPFPELYPEEVFLQSKKVIQPLPTRHGELTSSHFDFQVGEGSYGEVFLLPSTLQSSNPDLPPPVLKVVPVDGSTLINGEAQTLLQDMLAEIVVSTELSKLDNAELAPNFVKVVGCFLTEGCYPERLLALWDDFDEERGSENDRPGPELLPMDQKFVALVFSNGGKDLEASELTNASRALSIFNQVVHALAVAEEVHHFEHRDLHWGNILVRPTEEKAFFYQLGEQRLEVKSDRIQATIIDFSLSRLTSAEDQETVIFNDLGKDPALFKASGDYQFDIYRMMKKEVNNEWGGFHPKTNVFWLHYLLDKFLDGVPYKLVKSKIHRQSLLKLRSLHSSILDYGSAREFVLQRGAI
eukprot:maker-scaffold1125_size61249-snap-gene-0.14 protein:Tk00353 transcript:maker-scaffold1125_size61249-snap-gene-0.14-mRNA-1 annotation:"haspin-like protein"